MTKIFIPKGLMLNQQTFFVLRRLRIIAFTWKLSACFSLFLLCGCSMQKNYKMQSILDPIARDGPVLVFCGQLQTNRVGEKLGSAKYQMETISKGGRIVVTFNLVFYSSTFPKAALPMNALLAMVHGENGCLELLGYDASRSIAVDTPENRRIWQRMCSHGQFLPPRRAWIRENAAIILAQKAIGLTWEHRDSYIFKLSRYEIGWLIRAEPKGDVTVIGSGANIVVGDDGEIKLVSRGF
jgi:hypothetical protein